MSAEDEHETELRRDLGLVYAAVIRAGEALQDGDVEEAREYVGAADDGLGRIVATLAERRRAA